MGLPWKILRVAVTGKGLAEILHLPSFMQEEAPKPLAKSSYTWMNTGIPIRARRDLGVGYAVLNNAICTVPHKCTQRPAI